MSGGDKIHRDWYDFFFVLGDLVPTWLVLGIDDAKVQQLWIFVVYPWLD